MKPIVNYGLSDSLIDAVRKSVEEAKLHPNQQKLDVHEPKEDELTSHDFRKLRAGKHAGKHAGKKVKDGIDTHPKSMDEDEQIDEVIYDNKDHAQSIANKLKKKHDDGNYFVKADHGKHRIAHAYYSNSKVKKDISRLNEDEQIDEAYGVKNANKKLGETYKISRDDIDVSEDIAAAFSGSDLSE